MSYTKHSTIVITSGEEEIKLARKQAKKIFKKLKGLVSPIVNSQMNGYYSFFIAPSGSKIGWDTAQEFDNYREKFIKYLRKSECSFVEVVFGGDDSYNNIVNSN